MNFAPESISPISLPSLPLDWRKGFPACPAIYFALSGETILYIGRSRDLANRWVNHHRQAELEILGNTRIAWMEVSDPDLLPPIEEALIRFFKPLLNKRNVRVRRKPNFNSDYKLPRMYEEEMAERPVSVRLTAEMDKVVRSRPNRTEWLREAIAEKLEREQRQESASA